MEKDKIKETAVEDGKTPETAENAESPDIHEINSYSDASYKKVAALRQRGKVKGVELPYLKYDLTRPAGRRPLITFYTVLLYIIASVCALLAVAAALYAIGLAISVTIGATHPEWDILGIAAAVASVFGMLLLWILVVLFIVGAVVFTVFSVFCFISATECVKLTRATDEELALGVKLKRFNTVNIVSAIIIFVLFIIVMIATAGDASVKRSPAPYAVLAFGIMLLTAGIVGIKQRKKYLENFSRRPQEERDDINAHFAAMKKISGKKL